MNDLVRDFIEANPQNHVTLKHLQKMRGKVRRLKMFKKFIRIKLAHGKPKLSFEINFDEDSYVISRRSVKVETKQNVTQRKKKSKETEKQTKNEPTKEFIRHIVKLGFDATDAARLYKSKDDWLGMTRGGRILCSEPRCAFSTPLSSNCMFAHCRTVHGWREYPCMQENCEYVAYSKTSAKRHLGQFHSPYKTHNGDHFSCQRANCKAAFAGQTDLERHERIHSNNVRRCVFCPYVNTRQKDLHIHQRNHFNTREFKCNVCEKAFTSLSSLNKHSVLHDAAGKAIKTQCPLCERVDLRLRIRIHLNNKHKVKGVRWDANRNGFVVPKQI